MLKPRQQSTDSVAARLLPGWSVILATALTLLPTLPGCDEEPGAKWTHYPTDEETSNEYESDEEAVKQHALQHVQVIHDFHTLYPDHAIRFVWHHSDHNSVLVWNSTTWIYDRYELSMKIPIKLTEAERAIASSGEPVFELAEITRVEKKNDDVLSIHYGGL